MTAFSVFCLPHAGAGATFYRGWQPAPEVPLTLIGLQPPGREERFAEAWTSNVAELVVDLLHQLDRHPTDGGFALFGHSFGAVVAYELARQLSGTDTVPAHLVVSGSADAGQPLGRDSASLNDAEFLARVEELAGYTHPALADEDMRELMLPVLRSDVHQHEAYRSTSTDPLPIPITAFRGEQDHLVSEADARGWADWTSAGFSYREFPGGHMYLADQSLRVRQALAEVCGLDGADRSRYEPAQ